MRECWVLEEHSKGEGWYPLRCAGSKEAAEAEMRSWPASTLYPKRVVRYVPADTVAQVIAPPQEDRPTTRELSGTVPDIAHSRNCQCSECAPTQEDRE